LRVVEEGRGEEDDFLMTFDCCKVSLKEILVFVEIEIVLEVRET
jgi:hypothetical protein